MAAQPENYENDICHSHVSKEKCFLVLILLCIEHIIRKETKSVISEVLEWHLTIEAYLKIDPNVNFQIFKANLNIGGYTLLKYVCQKIDIKFKRLV